MALAPQGIAEIVRALERVYKAHAKRPVQTELVCGSHNFCKAENAGSQASAGFFSSRGVEIGQRGIYIKPRGIVPCGVKGTVIGVYEVDQTQQLELILDEDNFGASDLHGRATAMRGVLVSMANFMPLPRIENAKKGKAKKLLQPAGQMEKFQKSASQPDCGEGGVEPFSNQAGLQPQQSFTAPVASSPTVEEIPRMKLAETMFNALVRGDALPKQTNKARNKRGSENWLDPPASSTAAAEGAPVQTTEAVPCGEAVPMPALSAVAKPTGFTEHGSLGKRVQANNARKGDRCRGTKEEWEEAFRNLVARKRD